MADISVKENDKSFKQPWWLQDKKEIPITITYNYSNRQNPCANCSNNPNNGGTGICHCVIGMSGIYC